MTRVRVHGGTDVGRVRERNEDAFVISDLTGYSRFRDMSVLPEPGGMRFEIGEQGVLLAVSDGLGGHKAGDIASALVVEALRRHMANEPVPEKCCVLMEKAVNEANHEVWEAAHTPWRKGMGATLTAVFLHDKTAHIAEVGDSRAYLIRGGQIRQVTRDQSYTQLLVDSGAIRPDEAKDNPQRNLVLQAMGLESEVKAALGCIALRDKDCFLLCSDGLSNKIDDAEMRDIVLRSPSLERACEQLIAIANERGGEDNVTVIVAGVSGDLPPYVVGDRISDTLTVLQEFEPSFEELT